MKPVLKAVCTLLVVPMFAHAELKSMEDTEMSESVGRDGINVLMDLRMTGSMAYFQEKGGDTNSVSFTNFALNGEGAPPPASPTSSPGPATHSVAHRGSSVR